MPRVRELVPADKRKNIIRYCLEWKGWEGGRIEKELGLSQKAFNARIREVDKFSLGELTKILHGVPLSPAQLEILMGGITWETSALSMEIRRSL